MRFMMAIRHQIPGQLLQILQRWLIILGQMVWITYLQHRANSADFRVEQALT